MDERPGAEIAEPAGPPAELPEADRLLRALPDEARPTARYLLARLAADSGEPQSVPRPASIEALKASVGAVREAILDAGDRGLAPDRSRALHALLDQELAQLAGRLLERSQSESRALIRDVSHDLRSPLGSILFLADALAGERSGPLNEVQRRQADVLSTAAFSLEALLNDLIDGAQLGDARVERVDEGFAVRAVLDQVEQLAGPLAAQHGVELEFGLETEDQGRGDRRTLTRVLLNLVSNAIRATPRGGRVEIMAGETRVGWLGVTVEDSGTEADIERIRSLLTAATLFEGGHRERGWTHGLGLSICARLMEASEGRIEVRASPTGGCRFALELPFRRERGGKAVS